VSKIGAKAKRVREERLTREEMSRLRSRVEAMIGAARERVAEDMGPPGPSPGLLAAATVAGWALLALVLVVLVLARLGAVA
jgi:hypothetical protein